MAKQRRNVPAPIEIERTPLDVQVGQFTAIANWYLDDCMCLLSGDQFKVLATVIRKTIGWKDNETGKQKVKDRIAYSQFEEYTGLSDDAICRALDALKRYRLVLTDSKKPGRRGAEYMLQLDPSQVDYAAMEKDTADRAARNASKTAKARNAPRDETRNTRVHRAKNTPVPLTNEELNTLVDREQGAENTLYTREQKPVNRLVSRATIDTSLIETSGAAQRAPEEETIDTVIHSDKSEFIGPPLAFSPSGETQSAAPIVPLGKAKSELRTMLNTYGYDAICNDDEWVRDCCQEEGLNASLIISLLNDEHERMRVFIEWLHKRPIDELEWATTHPHLSNKDIAIVEDVLSVKRQRAVQQYDTFDDEDDEDDDTATYGDIDLTALPF